jgi:hypothetical protein
VVIYSNQSALDLLYKYFGVAKNTLEKLTQRRKDAKKNLKITTFARSLLMRKTITP